jgi:TrmH family RNA methyltransferase
LFLAEGARLVEQGLAQDWSIETLLISTIAANRPHIAEIASIAANAGTRVVEAPERLMAKIARKDNPQSILAAFKQRETLLSKLNADESGLWIALYEVRDPGNLGTIMRTADCAGIKGVILLETCCDPWSVEAVRASMGSIFDCPLAHSPFTEFNTWRRGGRLNMIAASVNGTIRHDKADYGDKSVILMGNEQAGLPPEIEAACDTLALIPMRGGADSLNLAQSTAIMTYEAWRQRDFT